MRYLLSFSLLRRNRNFRLLYIGQFVSFFGTMITSVALPYQIYMQTHSTLMVGLLSLAQLGPLLFTALIGGVFADRYHRRQLLLIAELVLMLGSLVLAWNASLPTAHISVMFITAALMSAFNGLHRPALESMVQQIVAKEDFASLSSLGSFKFSIGMIAGPAVGGILLANFGIAITYLVDVVSFAVSFSALFLMRNIPKPMGNRDESVWQSLSQGFHYAFSRQELLGTYIVDFIAMVFGMPMALFPAIALSHGGAQVLGMLYAAPAVGALVAAFFSGWVSRVKRHGVAIAISALLWGVAIIFFGLLNAYFMLSLFFLALAGAFDALSGIFRTWMWNETIPNALRGRLAGIEMISYLSGPKLGDAESGLVAAAFGVTASIVSGGVLCVVGVAFSCLLLPKFWRYRAEG